MASHTHIESDHAYYICTATSLLNLSDSVNQYNPNKFVFVCDNTEFVQVVLTGDIPSQRFCSSRILLQTLLYRARGHIDSCLLLFECIPVKQSQRGKNT